MKRSKRWLGRLSGVGLSLLVVLVLAQEVEARGRSGGGGGGGRASRGGSAQWGSIRHGGGSGSYRSRSQDGGSRSGSYDDRRRQSRTQPQPGTTDYETRRGRTIEGSKTVDGNTTEREATITGRSGETIDYEGSTTRTDEGISRSGSFETSTGASGSGKAEIEIGSEGVKDVERTRKLETADGKTMKREIESERDGDWRAREGKIETSTGIDAKSDVVFQKTDEGFIAQGVIEGDDYVGAGTVVRDGDDVYRRGAVSDGDEIVGRRMHCDGGDCHGARYTADIDNYYYHPYYYYPYYHAYYACPSVYSTTMVIGYYGTPVYTCSQTYIVSVSVSTTSYLSESGDPLEVQATTAPVVMYDIEPGVVVYSTSYAPQGVYAKKKDGRHYWVPGLEAQSKEVAGWIARAIAAGTPTANATVITYTIGDHLVYLTNEAPAEGVHASRRDDLHAWIAGVRDPSPTERDALETALTAHAAGGSASLEKEVRKLQDAKAPPAPAGGES